MSPEAWPELIEGLCWVGMTVMRGSHRRFVCLPLGLYGE
jgi:hypothetical protein